jgi:hypothetical protein
MESWTRIVLWLHENIDWIASHAVATMGSDPFDEFQFDELLTKV